jgi:ABC-type multidrug transport system fused ATPase/permease subunit
MLSLRLPNNRLKDWSRHFLPLLRPSWKELTVAALAMGLDAALSVARPWPLKIVIDRVLSHKPSRVPLIGKWLDAAPFSRTEILYSVCAATLIIALITGLLTYLYTSILGRVGQRLVFALRRDLFAHMQRLSLRFHDGQRTGDLTTRLTSDIQAIQDVISNGITLVGSNTLLLMGMLALMLWLDWRFALAALSVTPFLFWATFRYTRRIKLATRKARVSTGLIASLAQETLASIRIVQGLAQEDRLDDRFQARSEDQLQAYLESVRYQARIAPLVDGLAAVGLAIVMWYGATRVLAGELTTGDVVIFFAYVTSFYAPMKAIARSANTFGRASVGMERIAEVFSVRSEVTDRTDARSVPRLRGHIVFQNVSFAYVPAQPVLSDITLNIAPGEKVAIVGATGAGKSTLVSLVPRFYDPSGGAVCIDGNDIRSYTLQSLREQISMVLQESLLFSGSILDNIAFSSPEATDEQILAAAVAANADEFIQRLPDGYQTLISERGTTLSGGQKQRIAVARAILRDAPILILDEPTTGLDASSERMVMEALERVTAGRTTLMIAHRLTTVRLADRIAVLDRGRLVEEGTLEELLARNGRFARLYRLQALPENEDALT